MINLKLIIISIFIFGLSACNVHIDNQSQLPSNIQSYQSNQDPISYQLIENTQATPLAFQGAFIWNNTSQKVIISQDNGYLTNQNNRYVFFESTASELTNIAKDYLLSIQTTDQNLECINNGTTYSISISDGLTNKVYHSTNSDCHHSTHKQYIHTQHFKQLIELL